MKKIVLIPGDGIGPEIVTAAQSVLAKAAKLTGMELEFETCLAGGAAIDAVGVPLPEETIAAATKADAVLLGAVGGPKWDNVAPHLRAEKAILGLRKALGLYANLRPIRVPEALVSLSPLKAEKVQGVDILIMRELSSGIYYGAKVEAQVVNGQEEAHDTETYHQEEIDRIQHMAFKAAQIRRNKVTSVDKANVLATSRLWRKRANTIAEEYSEVSLDHLYIDNCAMQLILNPRQFDVVVTSNLFGDIISDEAAVLTGSIGMLPSASLGNGTGLYEPIHGSAPDIAGQGLANPVGTILSAAMLLRYSLNNEEAAQKIEAAVDKVLKEGFCTADLAHAGFKKVSTQEMGQKIEAALN